MKTEHALITDEQILRYIRSTYAGYENYVFSDQLIDHQPLFSIVGNIEMINEAVIDASKDLFVRNLHTDRQTNCGNIQMICDSLDAETAGNSEKILQALSEYNPNFNASYVKNGSRWVNLEAFFVAVSKAKQLSGNANPRAFFHISKFSWMLSRNVLNSSNVRLDHINTRTLYELLYIEARKSNYDVLLQPLTTRIQDGKCETFLISKYFTNFALHSQITFDHEFHVFGVISGIAARRGKEFGKIKAHYYQFDLHKLLTVEYAYLNLNVELDQHTKRLLVNGKAIAHPVLLLKKEVACQLSSFSRLAAKVLLGGKDSMPDHKQFYDYTSPIELDSLDEKQLNQYIQSGTGAIVYQVDQTLYDTSAESGLVDSLENVVLAKGEFFNAPHNLFSVTYQKTGIAPLRLLSYLLHLSPAYRQLEKEKIQKIKLFDRLMNQHQVSLSRAEQAQQAMEQTQKAMEQAQSLASELGMANEKLQQMASELTDQKQQLEQKVAKRTLELQQLNEKRMNTFANLAHEMKTPLTLLKDYMHGLALAHPDSEQVHFAKKHISKLSRDVVNLFDLLRGEKGIHQYDHKQACNLSTIVHERILLFQASAHRRRISISHRIEPNLAVQANQTALERVVNNLIDNAIKYSPDGSVISISLTVLSERELQLSITDQGVGIEPQYQEQIFQPYERISHTHSHGMGMGLPIVKTILDQIGGTIQLTSNPDQKTGTTKRGTTKTGTTFTIRLPYQQQVSRFFDLFLSGHEQILAPQPPSLPALLSDEYAPASYVSFRPHEFIHDAEKKTVLVVEDNVEMLQLLVDYLTPLYNTYPAFDGAAALEKLKAMPEPDLILSDVMMPQMDGFTLRRELIATESKYLSIPFLFLSAKSEEKMKGLHLKADFIEKPFDIQQLLAKINSLIALRESNIEQTRSQMIQSVFGFSQHQYSQHQSAQQPTHSDQAHSDQTHLLQNYSQQEGSRQDQPARTDQHPVHNQHAETDLQQTFFRKLTRMASDNVITSREKDILLLFLERLTNSQIADRCGISESTIKKHIQHIFQSLSVSTKEQAVEYVLSYRIE